MANHRDSSDFANKKNALKGDLVLNCWQKNRQLCNRMVVAYSNVRAHLVASFARWATSPSRNPVKVTTEWESILLDPMSSSADIQEFISRHTKASPGRKVAMVLVEAAGELLKTNSERAKDVGRATLQRAINSDWPEVRAKAVKIRDASPQ